MALGFCPALLMHMKYVTGRNTPETKITPAGFTKMLLQDGVQTTPMGDPYTLNNSLGHTKDLRLKYYKRSTTAIVSDEDNCDIDVVPVYSEMTIDSVDTAKIGIHIDNETIAKYCDEASRSVAVNGAPTPFMEEFMAAMLSQMPGMVAKINQDLMAAVTWGTNVVTGNNTAVTVNFNDDNTSNLFSEGYTKILNDYQINEGMDTPLLVGNGNINAAMIQAGIPDLTRYSPVNNAAAAGQFKYYFDINSATSWGANQFGIFMPGTVGLVQLNEFTGFRRMVSPLLYQFSMPMPLGLDRNGAPVIMNFDITFKYVDCPVDQTIQYQDVTLKRGWNLLIKKDYALWQLPSDAYQASDRLTGVNGALRYAASNT